MSEIKYSMTITIITTRKNRLASMINISVLREAFLNAMKRWKGKKHIIETTEKHGFTDTKYLCVGIVDISNSGRIAASMESRQIAIYYSTFINTMEAIARNFGAEVSKNMDDFIIFFFPKTSEPSADKTPFKDVLRCGIAMQSVHNDMNQKYYEQHLPPINYKISADYGKTEVAKSKDSSIIDVFGPTVYMCSKIKIKAPPNRMVIGKNLYDMINNSFEDDYYFTKIYEYPPDKNTENPYSVYLISRNG